MIILKKYQVANYGWLSDDDLELREVQKQFLHVVSQYGYKVFYKKKQELSVDTNTYLFFLFLYQ